MTVMTSNPTSTIQAAMDALELPWPITVLYRPRRTRLAIELGDGGVKILTPPSATPQIAAQFVVSRRTWIDSHVQQRVASDPGKRIQDGEVFTFLGREHSLRLSATGLRGQTCAVDPETNELVLRRQRSHADEQAVIARWYSAIGADWARDTARPYLSQYPIRRDLRITSRDLGTRRWGSYSPRDHQITLHWPLFALTEELAVGVLVHEIAHATRPGGTPHGPEWQQRMSALQRDWRIRRERRRRLERSGALWFGQWAAGE